MTANTFTSLNPNYKQTYSDTSSKKKRKFKVLDQSTKKPNNSK